MVRFTPSVLTVLALLFWGAPSLAQRRDEQEPPHPAFDDTHCPITRSVYRHRDTGRSFRVASMALHYVQDGHSLRPPETLVMRGTVNGARAMMVGFSRWRFRGVDDDDRTFFIGARVVDPRWAHWNLADALLRVLEVERGSTLIPAGVWRLQCRAQRPVR